MSEPRYFASDEEQGRELARLALLEGIFDSATKRHLEIIRPVEGWRCLEVGAGAGSVARWLATCVGTTGAVVATDVDTRYLRLGPSMSNLEIREHDILQSREDIGLFDLVHCRMLLMHLSEPHKAMERMAKAVRPGGWILIEEGDYGSVLSADLTDPSAAVFTETIRRLCDFLRKAGITDAYFGRQVPSLLEQFGFVHVDQDGWSRIYRGSEPMARFGAGTLQAAAKHMIAAGLLTEEQHEYVQRMFLDPSFVYPGLTLFAAWGQRPIEYAD